MASNDQPSSNLPSRFSKLSLRSSKRNANGRDDAKKSPVAPANAPNRDSGDETVNDRRRKIEVFDIKNVDNLVDCVVRSVRIAIANNQAMIAKEQNVFKIERALPAWEKLPTLSGQCSGQNAVTSSNGSSWSHDRMVRDKNKNLRRIYQEEGLNFQYHFGKITSRTDKMIEVFSEAMGSDIEVFDIKDLDNLVDGVVSSVRVAILNNPRALIAKQYAIKIDRTVPDWEKLPTVSGVLYSYKMPESIDNVIRGVPVERKHPYKANVQIAENPFANGSERQAFYGRVLSGNTSVDIVLKEYIRQSTASRNAAVPNEIATQMQTIAEYLAYDFIDSLQTMSGVVYDITFLKAKLLSIETKSGENRYMTCERRYGNDSKYLRFSNNADYKMLESTCKVHRLRFEIVEQLMAFSHWTYQITGGYLMVVDLQGIISTDESGSKTLELTDPAIHCKDTTRFGRTNLGEKGMKAFFSRHKCNKFCTALELKPLVL